MSIFQERKKVVEYYQKLLIGSNLQQLKIREDTEWNYHYFPVVFNSEEELLIAKQRLNDKNIFPRRYFYPSLNTIEYVNGNNCPLSEDISKRILCLPLFVGIENETIEYNPGTGPSDSMSTIT